MRSLSVIGRAFRIGFWTTLAVLRFLFTLPLRLIAPGGEPRRRAVGRLVGRVLREYLQNLGATFIKAGQILSTRPDLIPELIIDELKLLQDQVPPFPFPIAKRTLELAAGRTVEEVFAELDPVPIASASVAQVHRGVLHTGEIVAVKVRRPDIVRTAELDEAMMLAIARVVAIVPTASLLAPVESVQEFCGAIRDQLDFRKEAENNHAFQRNFAGWTDVRFPLLYPELCTEDVLVMEYVEGVKADDPQAIRLNGPQLARIGTRAILHMIFDDGFVHADLHPGNILLQDGPRVTFIDLGMVGRVDPRRRRALAELFFHITQNNGEGVARIMFDMSPTEEARDYDAFARDIGTFIGSFYAKSIGEVEVSLLIGSVFRLIRRHRIRCDPAFTLINVAFIVMEGLGKKLDPTMNLFEQTMPFLQRMLFSAPAEQPAS